MVGTCSILEETYTIFLSSFKAFSEAFNFKANTFYSISHGIALFDYEIQSFVGNIPLATNTTGLFSISSCQILILPFGWAGQACTLQKTSRYGQVPLGCCRQVRDVSEEVASIAPRQARQDPHNGIHSTLLGITTSWDQTCKTFFGFIQRQKYFGA